MRRRKKRKKKQILRFAQDDMMGALRMT